MENTSHVGHPYERPSVSPNVEKLQNYLAYPRMMLEVFLRRRFGKNYLSLWRMLITAIVLACWPFVIRWDLFNMIWEMGNRDDIHPLSDAQFWGRYGTWYAFLAAYMFLGLVRAIEATRTKGHTYYAGDLHPLFFKIKIGQRDLSSWVLEIICEPAVCFVCGYVLARFGQSLGTLIMVSSAAYSLSYAIIHYKRNAEVNHRRNGIIDGKEMAVKVMDGLDDTHSLGYQKPIAESNPDDEFEDVF